VHFVSGGTGRTAKSGHKSNDGIGFMMGAN
jgi:hypothetical protein